MQIQKFWTGTRHDIEIYQCSKGVKTKSQKVFEVNFYVCRSYKGKTGRWVRGGRGLKARPIMNR